MKKQNGFQRKVIALGVVALSLSMSPGFAVTVRAQHTIAAPATIATPVPALPLAEDVTVQLLAPVDLFTVGDPIELNLQVTHPAGTQVILPQLAAAWGDLEVREQQPAQTTPNADGTLTTAQTIVATLFAPGDFSTPPLAVTVSDATGQLSQAVAAPTALTIGSVLAAEDVELRDKVAAKGPRMRTWSDMAKVGMTVCAEPWSRSS